MAASESGVISHRNQRQQHQQSMAMAYGLSSMKEIINGVSAAAYGEENGVMKIKHVKNNVS